MSNSSEQNRDKQDVNIPGQGNEVIFTESGNIDAKETVQNTQGGDAAVGNIDKRNVYENCTFIQLMAKDGKFNNFSQESFKDIDFSSIPEEIIQRAYQESLPSDASLWNLTGNKTENNIEVILRELNEFRQLFHFFERLCVDEALPVEIRQQIVSKLPSKKYPAQTQSQTHQIKSYLIATLVPSDIDCGKFLLNSWLIIDDSIEGLSKFQSLVNENEQQTGTLCNLDQVHLKLNKILKEALRYLRGKRHYLTIEFFLPSELMCMEIDRWKIDPVEDEITLGTRYPIRLRSLERLDLNYLDSYLSNWYDSWDKVRVILEQELSEDLFEHLQEIESFNWKLLKIKLKEKIGLKVSCAHPQSIRKDLFRAVLQATTPIAIWTRTDIVDFDQINVINKILTFKSLSNLCESVRQAREKADAETEENLGLHLALLWENPYRLTPDVMVELTSPEQ